MPPRQVHEEVDCPLTLNQRFAHVSSRCWEVAAPVMVAARLKHSLYQRYDMKQQCCPFCENKSSRVTPRPSCVRQG